MIDLKSILAPKSTDRSTRYCVRLDKHLAGLADDRERAGFLTRELANWAERYRAWAGRVDDGSEPIGPNHATATDFILTIAEIGARQAKYPVAA